jgi:hypothetical protein
MSEGANIDFSGLSENEAETQFAEVEARIAEMEDKKQTQTLEFIEVLRRKLGLSQRLKKYQEVNNCEMRIRFIEARMRGDELPQTDFIELEHRPPRKKRNRANMMAIVVVAIIVMMIGSVPMIKTLMEHAKEQSAQLQQLEENPQFAAPVQTPPAATAPSAVPQDTTTQPSPQTTVAPTTQAATPAEANVQELNGKTGGQRLDLNKILKQGQTTALYFHSIHCPACVANKSKYAQLAAMYPEYKFYTVDVDRPFSEDIDRESPVCKQFNIEHFPYYMIFNGTQQQAAGVAASAQMRDWYIARSPK